MRYLFLFALAILSLAAADPAQAGDWPSFRGPKADSHSPERGINKDWKTRPPKQLWKVEMTDKGYSGICVAGGKVFVIDHAGAQDVVRALDAATGNELWKFPYQDTSANRNGFARSTPTFDEGRLYTFSRLGVLHCLDAASGKPVWSLDTVKELGGKRPTFDHTASPLVLGEKLVVMTGGAQGIITALDKKTGKVLWRGGAGSDAGVPPGASLVLPSGQEVPYGTADAPGYVTPFLATIEGRPQIICASARAVIAVNPADGKTLWCFSWPTVNGNDAADPLVSGNSVLITSGDKFGCVMLDIAGGKPTVRYKNKELQSQFNSPLLEQGVIYSTTDPLPGDLICMNQADGKVFWRQPGFEKGGVVMIDGVLLALQGKTGELVMVEPTTAGYKELGRFTPLGGQSWTPPALSDGKLFVRNTKAVACFDLK